MINIPLFNIGQRIVTETGAPTADFLTALNTAFRRITGQVNTDATLLAQIQEALTAAGIAITQANTATSAANAVVQESALVNSYVDPQNVLSATLAGTTATISVTAHTRHYGNGTTKAVTGGSVTGLLLSTVYYVYYVDFPRVGGTVTYQVTTDPTVAAQGSGKHCVGSIQTPAIGDTDPVEGVTTRPPGVPYWKFVTPDDTLDPPDET